MKPSLTQMKYNRQTALSLLLQSLSFSVSDDKAKHSAMNNSNHVLQSLTGLTI